MAKKRKKKAKELTKKEIRLGKKARRQKQMILVAVAIVAVMIVVLLAFGFYQEYIAKPKAPVAVVGEVPVRTDTYQKMVRYYRSNLDNQLALLQDQLSRLDPEDPSTEFIVQYYQQQVEELQNQLLDLQTLGQQVLDDLIDDELIRQEAARRGIAVTSEEVQLEIETQFGYERNPPTPTPTPIITATLTITPTPTATPMTPDRFQELYVSSLEALKERADFSEADFRRIFEASLLREKLQESMGQEVPTVADQVHARQIQVTNKEQAEAIMTLLEEDVDEASALDVFRLFLDDDEEEELKTEEEIRAEQDSQELLTQLAESEDRFIFLAQNFSLDTGNKDSGGDLGWFSRGQMVPEFEEAAFSTPAGAITGPVRTQFGWHVIFVQGTTEDPEPQVLASHILVGTEEEALAIMTLLDEETDEDTALSALDVFIETKVAKVRAKEEEIQWLLTQFQEEDDPFAFLAENFSEDFGSKDLGGDMDWFPRGEKTAEIEETAFGLAVGEISEPISSTIGFHIIEVLGHEERELASGILERNKSQAFEDWLEEQRQSEAVQRYWSIDKVPFD